MFQKKMFVSEDGKTQEFLEEVASAPEHLTDIDIMHSSFIMSIAKFISEYEQRLENPSLYAEIEDLDFDEIEVATNVFERWRSGMQIFEPQPEPLYVKNNTWIEYEERQCCQGVKVPVRRFHTRYFKLVKEYGKKAK
jgi:hypothetical protein